MIFTGAKCDKCGVVSHVQGTRTKREITDSLRKAGWTVGKRTICPKCKPAPKKHVILEE